MKLLNFFFLSLLFHNPAQAISLLQETQDIFCQNHQTKVLIDKKDRFFEVNSKHYELVEFLDSGILAQASDGEFALLQLTKKDNAVLITGSVFDFTEKMCEQVNDSKVCYHDITYSKLIWSPLKLQMNSVETNAYLYRVQPNDGTISIGLNFDFSSGVALLDSGSDFSVIYGPSNLLNCSY